VWNEVKAFPLEPRVEGRTLTDDVCKQVAEENILGCNIRVEETPYWWPS
jgi:hypothetical protein